MSNGRDWAFVWVELERAAPPEVRPGSLMVNPVRIVGGACAG